MYMKICVVGDVLDVITCAEFQNKIFRGYNFTGGRIFHFSYWFWMGLTTVQRYCTACDTGVSTRPGHNLHSSTTRLPMKIALLVLHQLSNARTNSNVTNHITIVFTLSRFFWKSEQFLRSNHESNDPFEITWYQSSTNQVHFLWPKSLRLTSAN